MANGEGKFKKRRKSREWMCGGGGKEGKERKGKERKGKEGVIIGKGNSKGKGKKEDRRGKEN